MRLSVVSNAVPDDAVRVRELGTGVRGRLNLLYARDPTRTATRSRTSEARRG